MRTVMLVAASLTLVGNAVAQVAQTPRNPAALVAAAQPSKYEAPKCGLKSGHFKVSSGAAYLKTGIENSVPDNKARAFSNGKRVLLEAIQQNDQGSNPAAWFYLGRLYLYDGDIVGADSAFTRAEALSPDCKTEIASQRENAWLALVRPATDYLKQDQPDSAMQLFRAANQIYRGAPNAYRGMGVIFANGNQTDSAIVYFQKTIDASTDPRSADIKKDAQYNVAAMLLKARRYPEAVTAFHTYLASAPDDAEAKKYLASAFRGAGMPDSARALESELVSSGGTGSVTDLVQIGVNAFNDKKYADAAVAFSKILETSPYDHDALYNLANCYVGLKDGPNLVATARRLLDLEPMNHYVSSQLASGYQLTSKTDLAVETLKAAEAYPINIEVSLVRPGLAGISVEGEIKGRQPKTLDGKLLKATPSVLVFEFIDASGTVVSSQPLTVPVIADGQTQPLKLEGKGTGIVSWRYRKG